MSFTSLLHWLLSRFTAMTAPSWYLFLSACILLLWGLWNLSTHLLRSSWPMTTRLILRHVSYPHILPRLPILGASTRLEVIYLCLYLLANTLFVLVRHQSNISSRTAAMALINLVFLLCGPRLSLVTRLLGVSFRASVGSHLWIGRTVIGQVLIHSIVQITRVSPFTWSTSNLNGVIAASAFGFIFLLSLSIVRRTVYEWFLNSHSLLAVVVLIAIYRHVPRKQNAKFFLDFALGSWSFLTVVHWTLFIARNFAFRRPLTSAVARRLSDKISSDELEIDPANVLQVDITIPRPWRVHAGQIIYLSVPRLGLLTGLRGHPFVISWWKRDREGLVISILVKSRNGFTSALSKHTNTSLLAFVDGPYGIQHDFGEYGTVIMFATGIGIAGHIPYIKELINGYVNCAIKTQRIKLIWEIKNKHQELWVKHWMDELLENDTGYILDITIHIQDGGIIMLEHGTHSRVRETSVPANVLEVLQAELRARRGRVMISVCARNAIADRVRSEVRTCGKRDVRLLELDFQPFSTRESGMDFKCQG